MSKSSTVTVREQPVQDVATVQTGGLTIHGETFLVSTDQRIELEIGRASCRERVYVLV